MLKNLAESLKWEDELASHTKKLVTYPALVGTVVLAVTVFLMVYLVPQMAGFIRNMGQAAAAADAHPDRRVRCLHPLLVPDRRPAAVPPPSPSRIASQTNPRRALRWDGIKLRLPLIGADPAQDHPVALRQRVRHDVCLGHRGDRGDAHHRGRGRQHA
ncbi:MAG: hypothetical protein MZW92_18240 [Comamonadaceae bacterium]|nr:hypothetical protein [Comamonadaceae bacterium]